MKECLARLIQTGRISGTYLFYGPPGSEQESMALAFISAVLFSSKLGSFPEILIFAVNANNIHFILFPCHISPKLDLRR